MKVPDKPTLKSSEPPSGAVSLGPSLPVDVADAGDRGISWARLRLDLLAAGVLDGRA